MESEWWGFLSPTPIEKPIHSKKGKVWEWGGGLREPSFNLPPPS